ncbi:hypothetical protein PGTUg99_031593 [Puccinia graminis f. sp. tritici]|uniref:Uncharacterized protein n=1 Tax=Puccinia graminis f. sp. tritici TaxID=56615 RepID=A0A5B0S0K3_PUCGR|nr:hypothetical protein PGTUg99_031593 [Puccinia graminis f. sp. tritici]
MYFLATGQAQYAIHGTAVSVWSQNQAGETPARRLSPGSSPKESGITIQMQYNPGRNVRDGPCWLTDATRGI